MRAVLNDVIGDVGQVLSRGYVNLGSCTGYLDNSLGRAHFE